MTHLRAAWAGYRLNFKFEAVTSRERMRVKDTYFIKIWDEECKDTVFGIGEAALFRGLSPDDVIGYESKLDEVCRRIELYACRPDLLERFPSIRMGLETALADFRSGGFKKPFATELSPIRINGLIWMGDRSTMIARLKEKLTEGFSCIKLKIGGIDFEEELSILNELRRVAPEIEIRLDANGAFTAETALRKLNRLAEFDIHSIEQPVRQGQYDLMADICRKSPIPVALDEELIGVYGQDRRELLERLGPAYIILKPTLCGGFTGSDEWIAEAERLGIGWWVTSALESNIGLNAIARYVSLHNPIMPQGLGTGELYSNNIPSSLVRKGEWLSADDNKSWSIPDMLWK